MIVYATILNVKSGLDKDTFIHLAAEWFNGIKGNNLKVTEDEIKEIEGTFGRYSEHCSFECIANNAEHRVGFRVTNVNDGCKWLTEAVLAIHPNHDGILSFVLKKEVVSGQGDSTISFRKPVFIKMLFKRNLCSMDGYLNISDKPKIIEDTRVDIEQLRYSIEDSSAKLPIVFISSKKNGGYLIDADKLASDLCGSAHVVCEKEYKVCKSLRDIMAGKNPFGGDVGLYFKGRLRKRYYWTDFADSYKESLLSRDITGRIVQMLSIQSIPSDLSFNYLEQMHVFSSVKQIKDAADRINLAAEKIALEREQYKDDVEKLIELMDEQEQGFKSKEAEYEKLLEEQEQKIAELNEEKQKLIGKNQRLNERVESLANNRSGIAIGYKGDEFFSNEIHDFLYSLVVSHKNKLGDGAKDSRAFKICAGIMNSDNLKNAKEEDSLECGIKSIMKGFQKNNATGIKEAESLGFVVEHDSNHFKLKYHNEDQYTITVAATASDNERAWDNNQKTCEKKLLYKWNLR